MRVLIAVFALVATPVLASVALGQSTTPGSGENRGVRQSDARSGEKGDAEACEKDAENSHRWQQGKHLGDKNDDKQCASSGTPGTSGGTSGTPASFGTISGFVFYGSVYAAGAPGVLGGSVALKNLSGTVVLSTVADFTGAFSFTSNVPAGSYQVCDVPPTMFHQVLPANNACYPVTIGGTAWTAGPLYFGLMM